MRLHSPVLQLGALPGLLAGSLARGGSLLRLRNGLQPCALLRLGCGRLLSSSVQLQPAGFVISHLPVRCISAAPDPTYRMRQRGASSRTVRAWLWLLLLLLPAIQHLAAACEALW